METTFTTNEYSVSTEQLSTAFNGNLEGIQSLELWTIGIAKVGCGQFEIIAKFFVDDKEIDVKKRTTNSQLVDAFNTGKDEYENGDDGFDNWDEVIETLFLAMDTDNVLELINEEVE